MSHSDDRHGCSTGNRADRPVDTLSEAADGDLHLVVTFAVPAADVRADGGGVVDAGPPVEAERDATARADGAPGPGALADCEPFVDSVTRPDGSPGEYTETPFGEAVDVESLVSYLGLDFVEHQLFADRFRLDADVVYTSRGVGNYQLLCVYFAGRGLLLVVDDEEPIRSLVGQARSLLTEA